MMLLALIVFWTLVGIVVEFGLALFVAAFMRVGSGR